MLPILSGVQKITLQIFQGLDLDRYDPYLVCAPPTEEYGGSLITEVEKIGVKVITVKSLKRKIGLHDISTFKELLNIFKNNRFDIIHTHSSKTGLLGRFAAKITGCPKIIHTMHGISFHRHQNIFLRLFYYKLEILAGFVTDKLVSVNKYYLHYFDWIFKNKLETIYNAMDYTELKSKEKRDDDRVKLVFVGRLDRQKNPFCFIKAVELALDKNNNIEVCIAGKGEYFNQIKEYLEKKKLTTTIKLLGWVDDIPQLLATSDILCSSSIYEAFGLVFCEAAFTGLPVIATAVEGVPEVVIHNKTGFLVPCNNEKEMSKRILQLASNKALRTTMGNDAKEWVQKKFDLKSFHASYKRLYELS